jgi:ligand-binding sensor domain-containing protein/serine phosphatase RsbU (regulator of sigma subunit)
MLKRVFLYAAFVALFIPHLHSQQNFFRTFSFKEGLPQSTVWCLLQDSRGYIWMGTDGGGVSRFDGNRFETFTISDGLSDNKVRSLCEDSKGNIWIGTNSGITLYDGFVFKIIGKDEEFSNSTILKIKEGSNGIIWAGTNDKGLFGLTPGDSLSVRHYSVKDGLSNIFIFDIYEDNDKRLWLAMWNDLNIIEFNNDTSGVITNIIKPDFNMPVDSTIIVSIEPGKDGTVWLGCYLGKGLFRAIPSSDKKSYIIKPSEINSKMPGLTVWDIKYWKNGELWIATDNNGVIKLKDDKIAGEYNTTNGIPSNRIYNIMEDHEGNCWLASLGQGVFMYDDEKFLSYGQAEGLIGNQVSGILFDANNIFYASTEEGFIRFRKDGNLIKRSNFYSLEDGLNDKIVNTLVKKENKIWIGTNNGINILDGQKLSQFPLNDQLPGDRKINCLFNDRGNNLWIGTSGGYGTLSKGKLSFRSQDEGLIHNEVQTIIEDTKGQIWMGTVGGLVRLKMEDSIYYADFNKVDGLSTLWINCLAEDPAGNIWIGTFGGGIFKFDIKRDSVPISLLATKGVLSSENISSILFLNDSIVVAGTDRGFDFLVLNDKQSISRTIHYGINDGFAGWENNTNSIARDKDGFIWFGTKNGLVRFDPLIDAKYHYSPATLITGIKLFYKTIDWKSRKFNINRWSDLPENLVLSYKDNHITFDFTGFSYHNPEDLVFRYILEPQSKEWSPYTTTREIPFSGLVHGSYSFKVQAKNKFGILGPISEFRFIIKPPFWKTKWFIISSILFILFLIISFIRIRERNLIQEKIKLEEIVKERTREVVEQKDEIAKQRDVVTSQKKEITDSIHYAERIQHAVLPDEHILKEFFTDYFILYMPKDIVSGDFYWMSKKMDKIIVAAADCTGHGVPGAFMSMLGVSFLNEIVNESVITDPSQILSFLRENIISALKQTGSLFESKDGMDIALCSFDMKKMKLVFAGANNPLYLFRKVNGQFELIERKADKMPVGFYARMTEFKNHPLDIQKGDTIYLFSDGFIDQFGGPDGRKFMKPRFKQMLLDHQGLDMTSQKETYASIIKGWITDTSGQNTHGEQIDDIIIMGIRI